MSGNEEKYFLPGSDQQCENDVLFQCRSSPTIIKSQIKIVLLVGNGNLKKN